VYSVSCPTLHLLRRCCRPMAGAVGIPRYLPTLHLLRRCCRPMAGAACIPRYLPPLPFYYGSVVARWPGPLVYLDISRPYPCTMAASSPPDGWGRWYTSISPGPALTMAASSPDGWGRWYTSISPGPTLLLWRCCRPMAGAT
jgi:hypothetical protein